MTTATKQQEKNYVKMTLQVNEATRKDWKQYALDHDLTVTDAIKKAMREMIAKDTKTEGTK